jgi:NitT/TauT family transport system permease protein
MNRHHQSPRGLRQGAAGPNLSDLVALALVFGVLALIAVTIGDKHDAAAIVRGGTISLDPWELPYYACRSALRMVAAMVASLLFTMTVAPLAAKNRHAELVLIPALDVLQSVPVLGYVSFSVTFFLAIAPNPAIGGELAAIFAIFTSQAWNMAFSVFQSLRTIPRDLNEAAGGLQLSVWHKFWRLELPFAIPGLVWNMMMSMSGGWFFVIASEAVTVGSTRITLPGIGSYLAAAILRHDLGAVGWVLLAMTAVILLFNQLLFHPLAAWADKFRFETTTPQAVPESWLLDVLRRTRFLPRLIAPVGWLVGRSFSWRLPIRHRLPVTPKERRLWDCSLYLVILALSMISGWQITIFLAKSLGWSDLAETLTDAVLTLARVVAVTALASLIWVPIGVWIGLRPRLAARVQPIVQFLAALPANLLFPIAVVSILRLHLNAEVWVAPLMLLGAQWYILFNVIAGMAAFPNDLRDAARVFRVKGWRWWRSVILPGIFPHYLTGALTAAGGAWNASIVAEYLRWGDAEISVSGIGAYIAKMSEAGDYPRILLGVVVMSRLVTLLNRLFWRRLQVYAEDRFRLE